MSVPLPWLGHGVRKVGQQREVQMRIAIRKKAHFKIGDQFAHLFFAQ